MNRNSDSYEDMLINSHIQIFKSQLKENDFNNLTGNILILADRLYYLATELHTYMKNSTDTNIVGVISNITDLKLISSERIDYLIIVGYLEKDKNYNLVSIIRSKNQNVKTVQWAMLDSYIISLSKKYDIFFIFDRLKPASEFMKYLSKISKHHDCDMNSIIT